MQVFSRIVKKLVVTKECLTVLFSPEKLALFSSFVEAKPSPGRNILKLLTFDNFFPSLRHSR